MKLYPSIAAAKKTALTIVLTILSTVYALANNYADSDLSNSAGSNSGKDHMGMYIAICMFLVASVVIAYTTKTKKST